MLTNSLIESELSILCSLWFISEPTAPYDLTISGTRNPVVDPGFENRHADLLRESLLWHRPDLVMVGRCDYDINPCIIH